MVDARSGEIPGVILEHPLFKQLLRDEIKIPDELSRCRVDLAALGRSDRFRDPVGLNPLGKSAGYDRESMVAKADVTMEAGSLETRAGQDDQADAGPATRKDTGLIVLAIEDYASIVAPANDLSRQLGQLALMAAPFLFVVTIGMWLFVNRMLRESRQRLSRAFSPSGESSLRKLPAMPTTPYNPQPTTTEKQTELY